MLGVRVGEDSGQVCEPPASEKGRRETDNMKRYHRTGPCDTILRSCTRYGRNGLCLIIIINHFDDNKRQPEYDILIDLDEGRGWRIEQCNVLRVVIS